MSRWFPDVRVAPLRAGLMWAALFVPLVMLINALFFDALSLKRVLITIPLAIIGGIIWAYFTRWFLKRRAEDAR